MSPRPLSKVLSDAQVVEMRVRYAADPSLTHPILAAEYGIGKSSVTRIINGKYRPDLGGPRVFGRVSKAPIVPGDCDIVYTFDAAASFLGVKRGSVREYLMRGALVQEAAGLVTYDSLVKYQVERQQPPAPKRLPPPIRCRRCTILEHEDGLCELCKAELEGNGFVLYHQEVWI